MKTGSKHVAAQTGYHAGGVGIGMNKALQITAKIHEARAAMRGFWGEKYAGIIADYQHHIRAEMQKSSCDKMTATMKLVALFQEKVPDSGMQQALVLAAYAEMVEPGMHGVRTLRGR